jgi:hypothetical protein
MTTTNSIPTVKSLLRSAIDARLECEYMNPGASPAKRSYYEGRIAALLECLTEDASASLGKIVKRYTTEKHAPGDDITYPEGTSVQWMAGGIQAAQDVMRGAGTEEVREQVYDSAVIL